MATFAHTELPASIHTEVTILGACLLDSVALSDATEKLKASDFMLDSHQRIYRCMCDLMEAGKAVDLTTLRVELERRRDLDAIGGPAYLFSLTEGVPRNLNIEAYVQIVKDKSLLRQLMGIFREGADRASDQGEDAITVLGDIEAMLAQVADSTIHSGLTGLKDIFTAMGGPEKMFVSSGEVTGLRTHFTEFDRMTCGLQKSELVIIAARPSMGKTAYAINLAQNAALHDNKTVAIFSLEMSKESLLKRMLASQASVTGRRMAGFIGSDERKRLYAGMEQLQGSKLFIDDTPGISLQEMRAKARRLKQQEGLDLILVDYLQLMTAAKKENRTQEVSAISRGLKSLAKEMNCPVVALSQLSRNSEQRAGNKKPLLSDLRESGSIEQDADVVAFIHREEYYDRNNQELQGKAELIVAKQRNGPTGTINLAWISEYTKFENLA